MQLMMDGNLVIHKYPNQNYSTVFNKSTGFFARIEDVGHPEPFWAMNGPELLDISITNYCERGCEFCYRNSTPRGKHILFEDYKEIIRQAKKAGVLQVALGGGNPNQHPQFIQILKETFIQGIVPSYTSNGTGLNHDILKATKEFCGALAISAYSPYESYLELIVNDISKYDIKTNIHFLLNTDTIERAILWLKQPPAFLRKINAIIYLNYKPINSSRELLLKNSSLLQDFFEQVEKNKTHLKIGFDSCSISGIVKYLNVSKIFYESCEAARFSAFISEDLKMYPCSFMINTDCFGDLKDYSIIDIWKNSQSFISHRNKILNHNCKHCSLSTECNGGCCFMECINLCSI
jgi:radical SAM protein with 4Fe4S-binding SPASM domain